VKTASQPIPVVDTRREHNKVREQRSFSCVLILTPTILFGSQ
jgi:hypothetical protein